MLSLLFLKLFSNLGNLKSFNIKKNNNNTYEHSYYFSAPFSTTCCGSALRCVAYSECEESIAYSQLSLSRFSRFMRKPVEVERPGSGALLLLLRSLGIESSSTHKTLPGRQSYYQTRRSKRNPKCGFVQQREYRRILTTSHCVWMRTVTCVMQNDTMRLCLYQKYYRSKQDKIDMRWKNTEKPIFCVCV